MTSGDLIKKKEATNFILQTRSHLNRIAESVVNVIIPSDHKVGSA